VVVYVTRFDPVGATSLKKESQEEMKLEAVCFVYQAKVRLYSVYCFFDVS